MLAAMVDEENVGFSTSQNGQISLFLNTFHTPYATYFKAYFSFT